MKKLYFLLGLGFVILLGAYLIDTSPLQFHKGITITAPDRPFQSDPIQPLLLTGATHAAVVPYAYVRPGDCEVVFNVDRWQWWGERPEGIRETIQLAKKKGLKVMLKPQVYVPGSWIGSLQFSEPGKQECFKQSYWNYIDTFLRIAEEEQVELFCLGTEMKAIIARDADWFLALIDLARVHYSGELTYAANWDNYDKIPFWDRLDMVGINAYFPLSEADTPSVNELKKAWQPIVKRLKEYSNKVAKPICFTEFGYLSVDKCASKTWELEDKIHSQPINEQCQCNALHAIWDVFSNEKWWIGGYLWKWFPEGMGHEGYVPRDYTPQGKLGLQCLTENFSSPQ